jgi:glycosyltransferase involved in cell wall biosynthesis
MQLTVMLTTFRRPEILRETLAAMVEIDRSDIQWQLLIVDNAGDEKTRQVCESFTNRLPLKYLVCTRPGKNAALNFALQHVTGELIIFTDDDVLPSFNWLTAMRDGATRWSDHVLFAGRVLPQWPCDPPTFVLEVAAQLDLGRWTYSVLNPQIEEGPQTEYLPVGNNMAVRRQVFSEGMKFNESIGPRGQNYAMGSETEFNLRLRRRGDEPVFLPDSLVYHRIRPEQMSADWLVSRAYREGRGEARLKADISRNGVLRAVKVAVLATVSQYRAIIRGDHSRSLLMRMRRALALGRLSESVRLKVGLA